MPTTEERRAILDAHPDLIPSPTPFLHLLPSCPVLTHFLPPQGLDEERKAILDAHPDLTAPGMARALQGQLDALLRRFEAVNLVHNLYAVYNLQPLQWVRFLGHGRFVGH